MNHRGKGGKGKDHMKVNWSYLLGDDMFEPQEDDERNGLRHQGLGGTIDFTTSTTVTMTFTETPPQQHRHEDPLEPPVTSIFRGDHGLEYLAGLW